MTPDVPNNPNCYGLDDLNSGDSSDDQEAPKKPVPIWATSEYTIMFLLELYSNGKLVVM